MVSEELMFYLNLWLRVNGVLEENRLLNYMGRHRTQHSNFGREKRVSRAVGDFPLTTYKLPESSCNLQEGTIM
jgi:hypothetical protein